MFSTGKQMFATVSVAFMIGCCAEIAFAQGSLTPPAGTPGETMRTLLQVEPRTPIAALPFTISAPGSYYLVSNLTAAAGVNGISVEASGVTIDLAGFTLAGSGTGSGSGIFQSYSYDSLRVLNGTVTGWQGAGQGGVYLQGASTQIDNIRAVGNRYGIYCEGLSRITGCTAWNNLGDGLYVRGGTLASCSATENLGYGITGESLAATDCTAAENAGFGFYISGSASLKGCVAKTNQGGGFAVAADSVVSACVADGNFANGVEALDGSHITGCTASNNKYNGIRAQSRARIAENVCRSNGMRSDGAGIYVTGFGCRVEKNHVSDTARGLEVTGADNVIVDNTVLDNEDNYVFASGNQLHLLLCDLPETLEWPCSVKLAGTLTCLQTGVNGITVNADDVTIDLAGHALVGPGADSGAGIYQATSNRNLRVTNGKLGMWLGSNQYGVWAAGQGALFSELQASTNNCGFYSGAGGSLTACTAIENRSQGFFVAGAGTLSRCVARRNGSTGLYCSGGSSLRECSASSNGGSGIMAFGGTLSGCSSSYNGGDGIYVDGSVISGCVATYNTGDGFAVSSGNLMSLCESRGNGGAGIYVGSFRNRIENNLVLYNNKGIFVQEINNFIARNSAGGNTLNWDVHSGNVCLVVNAAKTSGAISGDSGGVAPGSTDPNANFTH